MTPDQTLLVPALCPRVKDQCHDVVSSPSRELLWTDVSGF